MGQIVVRVRTASLISVIAVTIGVVLNTLIWLVRDSQQQEQEQEQQQLQQQQQQQH